MEKLALCFAFALLLSCNNKEPKKSSEINISEEALTEETPKSDMENSPIFQKLQGTWINNLDTLSTLRFEGATVINAYQDTLSVRTVGFSLGNSCLNAPAVAEDNKKDLYISTTGKISECYFIKELNDSILTMNYANGNIDLNFSKQQ